MATEPRTYDQILASLGSIYDPQVNMVNADKARLPQQMQADEQGLDGKQQQAFGNIMNAARSRGVGYGGIPIGEQQRYNSYQYMPAMAQLKQSYVNRGTDLEKMILDINEKRANSARGIEASEKQYYLQLRQQEAAEAEAARQAALQQEQMAMARAAAARSGGGGGGGGGDFSPSYAGGASVGGGDAGGSPAQGRAPAAPKGASSIKRFGDGGYNFTDGAGRPISAATFYAQKGGAQAFGSWRRFLSSLASAGDKGAASLLSFVGDDMGYDPRKITSAQQAQLYNAFMWGTGRSASYNAPAKKSGYQAPAPPANLFRR